MNLRKTTPVLLGMFVIWACISGGEILTDLNTAFGIVGGWKVGSWLARWSEADLSEETEA